MLTPFQSMAARLREIGFTDVDQVDDLGSVIAGLVYLHRDYRGFQQYVSLVSYEGVFCEAITEWYVVKRPTKRVKAATHKDMVRVGTVSVVAVISRSMDEILSALDRPVEHPFVPKWPTLEARLANPLTSRADAVRQLQRTTTVTDLALRVLRDDESKSAGHQP